MQKFELGDFIKNTLTGEIGSVCQIGDEMVFYTIEGTLNHGEDGHFNTDESVTWIKIKAVQTPSGYLYEIENDNVTMSTFDFDMEVHRCVVSSYLEQVFMQDGWEEIYDVEDQLAFNMLMGKFHLPEFIDAIAHFVQDGCSHWLLDLANTDYME